MHRLVRESFIFHVATGLPFQKGDTHQREIESALSLAEEAICKHFSPCLYYHPDSPVLGFQPRLFRCIYTIFRQHQGSVGEKIGLETWQNLDRDLSEWDDCIKKSIDKSVNTRGMPDNVDSSPRKPDARLDVDGSSDIALIGPRLYTIGCRILLQRMSPRGLNEPSVVINKLIVEGMDVVRRLQPSRDYYADYYCWPLLAIGINLEHPSNQDALMNQVEAFCVATNNGTMRRLTQILKNHWDTGPRRASVINCRPSTSRLT